jgi:hypothetical protein
MKKFLYVLPILFLNILCVGIAYGQNNINILIGNHDKTDQLVQIDNLMDIPVPATLAGIAVIAGNFLVVFKPHDSHVEKIKIAVKDFFKAFYFFLICTVLILTLDVIEVIIPQNSIVEIIDIILKYVLFGIGLVYLFKGSKTVMLAITRI